MRACFYPFADILTGGSTLYYDTTNIFNANISMDSVTSADVFNQEAASAEFSIYYDDYVNSLPKLSQVDHAIFWLYVKLFDSRDNLLFDGLVLKTSFVKQGASGLVKVKAINLIGCLGINEADYEFTLQPNERNDYWFATLISDYSELPNANYLLLNTLNSDSISQLNQQLLVRRFTSFLINLFYAKLGLFPSAGALISAPPINETDFYINDTGSYQLSTYANDFDDWKPAVYTNEWTGAQVRTLYHVGKFPARYFEPALTGSEGLREFIYLYMLKQWTVNVTGTDYTQMRYLVYKIHPENLTIAYKLKAFETLQPVAIGYDEAFLAWFRVNHPLAPITNLDNFDTTDLAGNPFRISFPAQIVSGSVLDPPIITKRTNWLWRGDIMQTEYLQPVNGTYKIKDTISELMLMNNWTLKKLGNGLQIKSKLTYNAYDLNYETPNYIISDDIILTEKIEAVLYGKKDYDNLFRFVEIQQPVKSAIAKYYNKITVRYRYKLNLVLSGRQTYELLFLARVRGFIFMITGLKYNHINDTTEIEMIGSSYGY